MHWQKSGALIQQAHSKTTELKCFLIQFGSVFRQSSRSEDYVLHESSLADIWLPSLLWKLGHNTAAVRGTQRDDSIVLLGVALLSFTQVLKCYPKDFFTELKLVGFWSQEFLYTLLLLVKGGKKERQNVSMCELKSKIRGYTISAAL